MRYYDEFEEDFFEDEPMKKKGKIQKKFKKESEEIDDEKYSKVNKSKDLKKARKLKGNF